MVNELISCWFLIEFLLLLNFHHGGFNSIKISQILDQTWIV